MYELYPMRSEVETSDANTSGSWNYVKTSNGRCGGRLWAVWVYFRLNDRNRCRLSKRLFFRSEIVIIRIVIVHQRFLHLSYLFCVGYSSNISQDGLAIQRISAPPCPIGGEGGWHSQCNAGSHVASNRGRSVVSISRNTPRRFPKPQRASFY